MWWPISWMSTVADHFAERNLAALRPLVQDRPPEQEDAGDVRRRIEHGLMKAVHALVQAAQFERILYAQAVKRLFGRELLDVDLDAAGGGLDR